MHYPEYSKNDYSKYLKVDEDYPEYLKEEEDYSEYLENDLSIVSYSIVPLRNKHCFL